MLVFVDRYARVDVLNVLAPDLVRLPGQGGDPRLLAYLLHVNERARLGAWSCDPARGLLSARVSLPVPPGSLAPLGLECALRYLLDMVDVELGFLRRHL